MCREDFEQLPKIKELIKQYNLFYCKKGDWYLSPNNYIDIENFLDGAWYTYKELKGNNNGRTHQAKWRRGC